MRFPSTLLVSGPLLGAGIYSQEHRLCALHSIDIPPTADWKLYVVGITSHRILGPMCKSEKLSQQSNTSTLCSTFPEKMLRRKGTIYLYHNTTIVVINKTAALFHIIDIKVVIKQ